MGTFFHSKGVSEAFSELQSSHSGLSVEEAKRRLEIYGENRLEEEKVSKVKILLSQFQGPLVYILLFASLISLWIHEWADFSLIIAIIVFNGLIGFWQELKAVDALEALKKLTETKSRVVRGGNILLVRSSELVPGDYVILHEGEVVAADMRLVMSDGLMLDEASITGESAPVIKDHEKILDEKALPHQWSNMVLSGSLVVRGMGRALVVRTREESYIGQIAKMGKGVSHETELVKALKSFTKWYVVLTLSLFALLILFGLFQGRSVLDLSYFLLASLVSAVPEGLPLVITLVMVVGAVSLSKADTLVRKLASVEVLGSASVIASDKTGTITEGKLLVKEVFSHDLSLLKKIAALCNDAEQGTGDPLDMALLDWVEEATSFRKEYPKLWGYPFDAKERLMASQHRLDGGQEVLLVKGAYESLKQKAGGQDLSKEEEALHRFLDEGLRVVAFGKSSSVSKSPHEWKVEIVGLIGFMDPPKKSAKEAVEVAKKAGVHVVMITGDHPKTALAIAKAVGIAEDSAATTLLTGEEIEKMSDEELGLKLKTKSVLARILPEHKFRVVKALQDQGDVVAVTGDGINDVPALKAANLGIAMGSGTEAAKSAAKMVILDNDLKVITQAIRLGRIIGNNLRKVVFYLLSTSMQELILISLSILFSFPLPLTAVQILWINLITDGLQDKTFAFAKEEGDVMKRGPIVLKDQFFDGLQLYRILLFAICLGGFSFLLYEYLLQHFHFIEARSILFTSVVAIQWANGVQSQKEQEPFFKNVRHSFSINPFIYLGMGLGVVVHCSAIYFLPEFFKASRLSLYDWEYPLLSFGVSFLIVELRKWIELAMKLSK